MIRKLDKIVVVDIEATCWDSEIPKGMISDIIEIGVCLLDITTGEITDNKGVLVKPQRSSIGDFCTQLTTITPEMVDTDGVSFMEALRILKKEYKSKSRIWASFGAYDMSQFQKQCSAMGRAYPFGLTHINVRALLTLKMKLDKQPGMVQALAMLGIPLEGTHHRGVDDAKNIAKILRWILNN